MKTWIVVPAKTCIVVTVVLAALAVCAPGLAAVGTARGGHVDHNESVRKVTGAFLRGESWAPWRTLAAAIFALPPEDGDLPLFQELTRRQSWPTTPVKEGWIIAGRRAGKSRFAALLAVYLACFRAYPGLAPGEIPTVMIIAADRRQARVTRRYVSGLLHATPVLKALIARETREAIALTNGLVIEIHTASFRTIRGYTVVGAVLDEVAFWPTDDAAEPDSEIVAALRPAMATTPGSLLLAISSPYARRGELWRAWREHFGKDGDDVLVWQAPTRVMNPTVPQAVIDRAMAEDPAAASAEWLAEFRRDVESFISREALEACVVPGRLELAPVSGVNVRAFVDPSGGSADSFTLATAYGEMRDGRTVAVLDCLREVRPPFSPESVVAEFAALLKTYGVTSVTGDRYAGEWPREQFRKHGIEYAPSERSKSDLYLELLPLLNSGRVELLDHPRLLAQLASLERRTARGGRDSIDHGPGAHDDVANACAGALVNVSHVSVPACGVFSDPGQSPGRELAARVRAMSQARLTVRSARLWRE